MTHWIIVIEDKVLDCIKAEDIDEAIRIANDKWGAYKHGKMMLVKEVEGRLM